MIGPSSVVRSHVTAIQMEGLQAFIIPIVDTKVAAVNGVQASMNISSYSQHHKNVYQYPFSGS